MLTWRKILLHYTFLALTVISTSFLEVEAQPNNKKLINMVFTSDAHYGISRKTFRGGNDVDAHVVNAAMISEINTLPQLKLPDDGGAGTGNKVGHIDYLVQTGDIANRMEMPYPAAATDWEEFKEDYIEKVQLRDRDGLPVKLLLAPGNHDITNAIGYYKPMRLKTDPTAMVQIYNRMLKPATLKTNGNYNFQTDKIHYSINIKGTHLIFITLWPDSAERVWMEKDLRKISTKTPVLIFTHDPPECEAKHFTNPNGMHDINNKDKFENLISEQYKDGNTAADDFGNTDIEQRGLVRFLKKHPNIKAYFHGNSNWNEFYSYRGPDKDVDLKVFRVDSPMKGKYSAKDEKRLSFQLITLDPQNQQLTVRECLWNTEPLNHLKSISFGESETISLKTRQ